MNKQVQNLIEEKIKKLKGRLEMEEDEKKMNIYIITLNLIYDFENMPDKSFYREYNEENKMWTYIGAHLQWYWN